MNKQFLVLQFNFVARLPELMTRSKDEDRVQLDGTLVT